MTAIPPFPGTSATVAQPDRRATEIYARFFAQLVGSLNERFSIVTTDTAPTSDDIPDGEFRVWKNTSDSTVKLYANDGGVLVETTLS
jgi:hypothetical protein